MSKTTTWIIILIIVVVGGYFLFADGDAQQPSADTEANAETAFTLTLQNKSGSQPLSPGVIVVHNDTFSLNYEGQQAPDALEPLAEYGAPDKFRQYVAQREGVTAVVPIDAPITPGEEADYTVSAAAGDDMRISVVQMLVATNDGIAVVDSQPLFSAGTPRTKVIEARNYDAGTEENEAPGSGFAGGQPDASRGAENVDNGTPTEPAAPVAVHPQITDTVLEATITPQ